MYGSIAAKVGAVDLIDSPIKRVDGDNMPEFNQVFESSAEADMKDGFKVSLKFWDKDLIGSDYMGGTNWVELKPAFDLSEGSASLKIGGDFSQYCAITYSIIR